jgi:hypothetical protein
MDRIVLTALAKKPEERFSDAKEFRTALIHAAGMLEPPAPAEAPPEYLPPQFVTQADGVQTSRAAFVFGALTVIGAILISYVVMH